MVAIVVAVCFLALAACTSAQHDHQACLGVTRGMPESDVTRIMGTPIQRIQLPHRPNEVELEYGERWSDSGPVKIILINKGSGYTVEFAACEGLG